MVLKVRHYNKKVDEKVLLLILINLVLSRHCESATGANPVPEYEFVGSESCSNVV